MNNCQKIEQARKQAGIADDIRTESFVGWKRAGYSVRKGEKAVFSVKLSKPNPAGGFKTVTDYFFTEKQVEPLTARPSRRGKDTESVSESAPVVDAPADPDPVEEEPAPVLSESEKEEEPAPSFRVAFEVRRYVAHLKWSEIGNGMTAQQVYNAVVNKASRQGFPSGVNRYELDTTADAVTEYDRARCHNDIRYWNGNLWGYTCVVTALYCVTYTTAEEWDNAVLIDWRALPVAPLGPTTEPLQLAYC